MREVAVTNSLTATEVGAKPGEELAAGGDNRTQRLMPLSMVCFIEELEPKEMPIPPSVQAAVARELQCLVEQPVLEALLLCLKRLSECA